MKEQKGFLYVILYNDYTKIGITKHPKQRLKEIKKQEEYIGNKLFIYGIYYFITNLYLTEQYLLSLFHKNKVYGEWFDGGGELPASICSILDSLEIEGFCKRIKDNLLNKLFKKTDCWVIPTKCDCCCDPIAKTHIPDYSCCKKCKIERTYSSIERKYKKEASIYEYN